VAHWIHAIIAPSIGDDAVSIEEVTPTDWTEKVYKPDILRSPGKLYKKPGYNPRV
jgi:4-oxalocrotonate tautomerase